MKLAPIVGIVLGVALLGLVFSTSAVFTYQATRSFTVNVVKDTNADIALIPNDQMLGYTSSKQPFVNLSSSNGELQIDFHNVSLDSEVTFTDVFEIVNNLNQTVSISVTTNNPALSATLSSSSLSPAGESGDNAYVTLTLNTADLSQLGTQSFTITITASYSQ
ncbi:hypothetical protein [Metallosphaera sedula]|uniref:hypothetical protein n=1 Tax=Metallosphaera sedula TaxID=43687 RepID=UPI0020BFD187|nr:hypothetical protein [Metallosphaera sedula]